jgi:hypothetical protein
MSAAIDWRDDQRFMIGNVPSHGASYSLQTRLHSNLPGCNSVCVQQTEP